MLLISRSGTQYIGAAAGVKISMKKMCRSPWAPGRAGHGRSSRPSVREECTGTPPRESAAIAILPRLDGIERDSLRGPQALALALGLAVEVELGSERLLA